MTLKYDRIECNKITIFFLLLIVLMVCFSMFFTANVCSATICELEAVPYSFQERNEFLNSIKLQKYTTTQTNSSSIVNMDVSQNGYVALTLKNRTIMVYDDDGVLVKQFVFKSHGSYYVRWNESNLALFFVRENSVVEFTLDHEIVGVYYVELSSQMISEIRNKTTDIVGNDTYKIENKLFFAGYTTLIKTDKEGNEIILYNSNLSSTVINAIIIVVFVLGFTLIPFLILRKQIIHVSKKRKP